MDGLGSLTPSVKSSIRNLVVTMDQAQTLEHQVKGWIHSCFFQLRNIAKLRSIVSRQEMEMLVHAFISSGLDYCNSLFTCLSKKFLDRLQVVQNAAAKLFTWSSKRSHVTPILISLRSPSNSEFNSVFSWSHLKPCMARYLFTLEICHSPSFAAGL